MERSDFKFLIKSILTWRLLLFGIVVVAVNNITLQRHHLGGGIENYLSNPYLWSLANFDGEHFLSIAMSGYKPLQYFFFPIYPMLVGILARFFGGSMITHLISGLVVSNVTFFLGLIGLMRLIRLDYKENITRLIVILLLIFPASFYFGAFYSESLFFALSVWSFYLARKGKWVLAGILGAFLTATRIVGLALVPALLVEVWLQKGKPGIWGIRDIGEIRGIWEKRLLGIAMIPVGIIAYMVYLNKVTGDPLEFFHSVFIYGEQRSSELILLPQVFYRYIFKILPNINYYYFPAVFTLWLEFIVGVVFGVFVGLGLLELGFKKCGWIRNINILWRVENLGKFKIRESYLAYLLVGYLIPTFSGSFSSFPRYILILFPAFIMIANVLSKSSKSVQKVYYLISFVTLLFATMLFSRGYWIS
jgi:hypothetical protein